MAAEVVKAVAVELVVAKAVAAEPAVAVEEELVVAAEPVVAVEEELVVAVYCGGGRGGDAQGGAAMIQRIMGYDKDDDGKISKAELPERMQAMFGRVDANSDDFLDKEELEKMASRMENRGGGAGGRGKDRGAGTRPKRPPNDNDDDREGDSEDRD